MSTVSKVIGRLMPSKQPTLPKGFDRLTLNVNEDLERLGTLPREVKPSEMKSVKSAAENEGRIGKLHEIYDKMKETDSRVGALVRQLTSELISLPLKVQPKEGATKAERALSEDYARVIEFALDDFDQASFSTHCIDAYLTGVRMFDLTWGLKEARNDREVIYPVRAKLISPAKYKMEARTDHERYGKLNILTGDDREYGVPVEDFDPRKLMIVHDVDMEGKWDVAGVSRTIIGWWLVKLYAQSWWAEYVENYGKPMRIGRYPDGTDSNVLTDVERFLQVLGSHGYAMIPEGIQLQLLEANTASNTTHRDLIGMANDEIALAIVGQVETQGDRRYGSQAKARELGNIRHENMKYASNVVSRAYTKLAENILQLNYGSDYVQRLRPSVSPLLINPKEIPDKVNIFTQLSASGIPIEVDHIYEQTGIPKPKDGEPVLIFNKLEEMKDGETGRTRSAAEGEQGGPQEEGQPQEDVQRGEEEEAGEGDRGES